MAAPLLAPMPEALDLQQGYTLRVTAVDPTTGNLVSGVSVGIVVLTADHLENFGGGGGGTQGEWMLVPGINA